MPDATLFQAIFYSASVPVVVKNQRDSEILQNKKRSTIIKIKHRYFFLPTNAEIYIVHGITHIYRLII